MEKSKGRSCMICGEDNFQTILDLNYTTLCKCKNDGLVSIYPHIDTKQLDKEIELSKFNLEKYNSLWESKKTQYYDEIKYIEKITQKDSLLDIGCGNGDFLRVARIMGWKTFGLDPNFYNLKRTSKYAKTKLGKLRKDSY